MWSELLRKWFGLPLPVCQTCEILRDQLDKSEEERRELLTRLLDKDKPEPPPIIPEVFTPIEPKFTPWRVRQQMLEAEDRKQAELMRAKSRELDIARQKSISELEAELGVENAGQIS